MEFSRFFENIENINIIAKLFNCEKFECLSPVANWSIKENMQL